MLPPGCMSPGDWSTPSLVKLGWPIRSAHIATPSIATKIMVMAASMAQPWRVSPTILPKV